MGEYTESIIQNKSFTSYTFNITSIEPNENIIIPNSWEDIGDYGTNTVTINNKDIRKPSFWRIKHIKNDSYKITSYASIIEYIKDK